MDTPPPVFPPAQIQMASAQAPAWLTTPDTATEIAVVCSEEPNVMGDPMMQRKIAASTARKTFIKRLYKDAGIPLTTVDSSLGEVPNTSVQYYRDMETNIIYCRAYMTRAEYQQMILSLQQRKR